MFDLIKQYLSTYPEVALNFDFLITTSKVINSFRGGFLSLKILVVHELRLKILILHEFRLNNIYSLRELRLKILFSFLFYTRLGLLTTTD